MKLHPTNALPDSKMTVGLYLLLMTIEVNKSKFCASIGYPSYE